MNKIYIKYIVLLFLFNPINAYFQTVGIINNNSGSFNGYTLLSPLLSTQTYLINNCGQVINEWSSNFTTGASVYLLENGDLLRTAKITNSEITFGGVGGKIELFDWDGNLLWEYTYSTNLVTQHHDIFPLPNGNILMLAVTTKTQEEAIQEGRDPSKIIDGKLYNEQIIELEPIGTNQANIVWEWNIFDHLIQDFDVTKNNYNTNISGNPQLLNINYLNEIDGIDNWLHINSIQYNATLDQIILSSRHLSEIYIIDHSTTTAEAATSSGGIYGKGGDILYRWGNKEAYNSGTTVDQTLFSQHYPHWIPDGLNDAGKIMIFNNENGDNPYYSSVDIINPTQTNDGIYSFDSILGFGPENAEWRYIDSTPSNFYSAIASSGQRLPNGNTFICDGDSGYLFEIDINNNKVWEYINPVGNNGILEQGTVPTLLENVVFRALKYSVDYPAFDGKDLTPGDPIELNFDISDCEILSVDDYSISHAVTIYPNPTNNIITLTSDLTIDKIEIFDIYGKLIFSEHNQKTISLKNITSGIYFLKFYSDEKFGIKKIIKQ